MKNLSFSSAYSYADCVVQEVTRPTDLTDFTIISDLLTPDCGPTFLERASCPHQETILHVFAYNLNMFYLDISTGSSPEESVDEYREMLKCARLTIPKWLTKDAISIHINELDGLLSQASKVIVEGAFHLLFSDREFLAKFQDLVAKVVKDAYSDETRHYYTAPGILRRKRPPGWLKKAVYMRDKGKCQRCLCDLSGILSLDNKLHYDHIQPLAESGTNDPCNFQLLCEKCNQLKGRSAGEDKYWTATFW